MGTLNLRSDRGQTIHDPAGVIPSRRLGTLVKKRTHWNQETKSLMEGEGQARSLGNSRPNRLCAHNHRYSKVAHLSHMAKQQRKPGENRVLASTVTSQVKVRLPVTMSPRQTYRGRRKTTAPHLNGRPHRKRNHLQWKPSFAINSDKDTIDPKG